MRERWINRDGKKLILNNLDLKIFHFISLKKIIINNWIVLIFSNYQYSFFVLFTICVIKKGNIFL